MNFSRRTNWNFQSNLLTRKLEEFRKAGRPILDLTVSNPTICNFEYPEKEFLSALSRSASLRYEPNPRGLLSAREIIAGYYRHKGAQIEPERIFLTASTSEAYGIILKLLCNPEDEVLIPRPSYLLLDHLAQLHDVQLRSFDLQYDGAWHVDFDSVKNSVTEKTRAILMVNPHNPTGMCLKKSDYRTLQKICKDHNIALISDEVFAEYVNDDKDFSSNASGREVLSFTLNGISKMCGLPQMKLGWIVLSGPEEIVDAAANRLEIITDASLSVNTPVQIGLGDLMRLGLDIRQQILDRVLTNRTILTDCFKADGRFNVLESDGGWYAVVQFPRILSDEEWALRLLDEAGVSVQPGYFFDFTQEGIIVVSLLPPPDAFREAARRMIETVKEL